MKEKESYIEKQKDIFGDTTWFTYRYEVNGMVYETSAGSLDICRKARDKWMKMMSVAFTGHRTIRTNKYALCEPRFVHPGVHVGGFGLVVDLVDGIGDLSAHFIPEIRSDVVAPRDLDLVTPVAHAPHVHGRQGAAAQADDARRDPQFGEDVVALLLEQVDRDRKPVAEHAHLGGDVVRLLLLPRDVGVACRLFVFAGEGRVIDRTVRRAEEIPVERGAVLVPHDAFLHIATVQSRLVH